jgi:hypothetical protein
LIKENPMRTLKSNNPTSPRHHPLWADTWNPYKKRESRTHCLDQSTLASLVKYGNTAEIDPVLFMHGCLDAPQEIPLGATACVKTIGGTHREEVMRLCRDHESWLVHRKTRLDEAEMLRSIVDVQIEEEPMTHSGHFEMPAQLKRLLTA